MDTRIETMLEKDGTLTLKNLPFHAGEAVEVTIRPKAGAAESEGRLASVARPFRTSPLLNLSRPMTGNPLDDSP